MNPADTPSVRPDAKPAANPASAATHEPAARARAASFPPGQAAVLPRPDPAHRARRLRQPRPGPVVSGAPHDIAQATAICHRCADQASCLAGAVQRRETYGIWGRLNLAPAPRRQAAVTGGCQPERGPCNHD